MAPIARGPVLSPDATYLVGPESAPDRLTESPYNEMFTLFVWKQPQEKASAKLKVPGWVAWLGFASRDQLVVLTYDGKPLVQLWNVARGKLLKSIYLTEEQFIPPVVAKELQGSDRRVSSFYVLWPNLAAASPGGRYLAVGGRGAVTLLDLEEGREVGSVPVKLRDNHFSNHRGLSFSPDGTQLMAWTETRMTTNAGLVDAALASAWSVTDGRKLHEVPSPTPSAGPLVAGPDPEMLLATGRYSSQLNYFATAVELPTGRVTHLMPIILRWSDNGPIVHLGPMSAPGEPPPDVNVARLGGGGELGIYSVQESQPRLLAALNQNGIRPSEAAQSRACGSIWPSATRCSAARELVALAGGEATSRPTENNLLESGWPAALGDHRAAVLRLAFKEKANGRETLALPRNDLGTVRPGDRQARGRTDRRRSLVANAGHFPAAKVRGRALRRRRAAGPGRPGVSRPCGRLVRE